MKEGAADTLPRLPQLPAVLTGVDEKLAPSEVARAERIQFGPNNW